VSGQTLTATTGTWSGSTPISYSYQWQRCTSATCSAIASATGSIYTVSDADVGDTLQVAVTASNASLPGGTSASADSQPTAPVSPTPSPPTVGQAPAAISGTSSATFTFSGDSGATFGCALDGAPSTPCTSPVQLSGLSDGTHTFAVTETLQGLTSAPGNYSWTIDTQVPAPPTIIGGPDPETGSTDATIQFQTDPDAVAQCSVDGGPFTVCTSPVNLSGLALGPHTFAAEQVDAAGITSAAAVRKWRIDVNFQPGDSGSNTSLVTALVNPHVAVRGDQIGVGCQLNRGSLQACQATATYDPATGASDSVKSASSKHPSARAASAKRARGHSTASAAAAEVVGTGSVVYSVRGQASAVVNLVLNGRGRALLARHADGFTVTLSIVATAFDNPEQFTTTKTTTLRPPQLMVVPNRGLFAGGSTTLDHVGRQYVRAVADLLHGATRVRCEGYTDNSIRGAHATTIGLKRARAVCDALLADGLNVRSSVISYGASRPLASNATAAGRARNRRVEIRVWF
jgi:outer membrane protein OmpA-like peptidoglycan-associated protein